MSGLSIIIIYAGGASLAVALTPESLEAACEQALELAETLADSDALPTGLSALPSSVDIHDPNGQLLISIGILRSFDH